MSRYPRPLSIPVLVLALVALSGAGGGGGDGCDPPDDDGDDPGSPASVTVAPQAVLTTSESGLSATFSVVLDLLPTAPVSVIVQSGDVGEWSVGEAPGQPDLTTANSLELVDVITLRYPHGPDAVSGDNGVHNQAYHFDGSWHFSAGTDTDARGWLFVNHPDGSLKCSDMLADPFTGPDPEASGEVHPGGGWHHDGRFYTVVSNQVDGDGGGFAIVSFAPGGCDAAANPDTSGCGCDVTWVQDEDGAPRLWSSGDYKGFGVGYEGEARLYDIYGSNAWTCSLSGEDCADSDAAGPAGGSLTCLATGRICPQECFRSGEQVVCTDFPVLSSSAGSTWLDVYPADPTVIDEFQAPVNTVWLPRALDLAGNTGQSNPEGVSMHDGQLYLAGDHPDGDDGGCGLLISPCTDGAGDQAVRVNRLVHDGQVLTFTADDWAQPQEVVVTGVDDPDIDGDVSGTISLEISSSDPAYAVLAPLSVDVINVDNDGTTGPLVPQGVTPPHGPDGGGQAVSIVGTGLLGITEVWFGSAQATIASAYETVVEVQSPPGPPGTVDVRLVRADGEEATLAGAWTWHGDNSGLYTGLARSLLVAYDPSYFWIGSPYGTISEPYVQLDGLFHLPIERAATLFGASAGPGECDDPGGASWSTVAVGPTVSAWSSALGQADLPDGGDDGVYRLLVNDASVWDWSGDVIDLEIVSDAGGLPPQYIAGAIEMPEVPDFDGYSWSIGNSWPRGQDLELGWSTLGPAADLVRWRVMPAQDVTPLGSLGCTVDGAGPLVVPWADIVQGVDESQLDALLVVLSFQTDRTPVLEHDASFFWGRGFLDLYFYFDLN